MLHSDTKYVIVYQINDEDPEREIISADSAAPTERQFNIKDFLNLTTLHMFATWNQFGSEGERTNCTISTMVPTPSPSNMPSESPTPAPTDYPTMEPTKYPTTEPTSAPTYTFNELTKCLGIFRTQIFQSDEEDTVEVAWPALPTQETTNDDGIPPANWITYNYVVGEGTNTRSFLVNHENAVKCNATNYCWFDESETLDRPGSGDAIGRKVQLWAEYTVKSKHVCFV